MQQKFSISNDLQCKLSNSYTEIQNSILIALNYAFFNDVTSHVIFCNENIYMCTVSTQCLCVWLSDSRTSIA